jgi:hypothetical protein
MLNFKENKRRKWTIRYHHDLQRYDGRLKVASLPEFQQRYRLSLFNLPGFFQFKIRQ